jgi:hypothetical protein
MNVKKYAAPDGALFLSLMRLQICRAYGTKVMEKFFRLIKIALPLAIVSVCLFGYFLNSQSGIFREFQGALGLLPHADNAHAGAKPLNVAFWYEMSRFGMTLI